MKMSLRDNLYIDTTNSIWVCLVEGRYLISNSARHRTSWKRRCNAVTAFKNSNYWKFICRNKTAQEIEDIYNDYLETGMVKFIEIKPIPVWADI